MKTILSQTCKLIVAIIILTALWSLWSVQPAYAQGPGGVSSNLELWLKGDTGTFSDAGCTTPTTSGGGIGCWQDQSGNGNHPTINDVPTYTPNAANHNPVVRLDGTNDTLTWPSFTGGYTQGEMFLVWKSNRPAGQDNGFRDFGTSRNIILMYPSSSGWIVDDFGSSTQKYITPNKDISRYHLYSTSSKPGAWAAYMNGQVAASSGANTVQFEPTTLRLGQFFTSYFSGDIAEVILYNQVLTDSSRIRLESYLSLKYGFMLDTNYYDSADTILWDRTANTLYHHNVAGIGRDTTSGLVQSVSHSTESGAIMTVTGTLASIANGEFLVWGHNNESFNASPNTPSGSPSPYRLVRSWKVQETGDVGTVTISFDLSSLPLDFSNAANFGLLVDDNGNFDNATIVTGATINGSVVTFSGVNFGVNPYISLAVPFTGNTPGLSNNLASWYKADAGTFFDSGCTSPASAGGAMRCWADQSGNNHHATMSDGSRLPTYQTNVSNGYSAVRFDNSNDGLSIDGNLSLAAPYTVFSVFNTAFPNETGRALDGGTNGWFLGLEWTGFAHRLSYYAGGYVGTVWPVTANQFYLTAAQNNGSASTFWIDDQSIGSNNSVTPPGTLGFGSAGLGFRPLGGDIVETLVYSTALSTVDQQRIETYLALKYGLHLAGNYTAGDITLWDAAANSSYHNQVAGIGKDGSIGLNHLTSRSALVGSRLAMTGTGASIVDGEFLLWGHNNAALIGNFDVPAGSPAPTRLSRVWKVQETGDVGNVTLSFDLSGFAADFSNAANFALLIDDNGAFNNATVTGGGSLNGSVLTFSGINLTSDSYLSLAIPYHIDLAVSKSINAVNVYQGQTVTYTINVNNVGSSIASGIVVTDLMPAGFVSTGVSSTDAGLVQLSGYPTYQWQLSPMSATSQTTIIVTGTLDINLALGTPLVNTATVASTSQIDNNAANDQSSVQRTIVAQPGGVSLNLILWLQGNRGMFSDAGCTTPSTNNTLIGCWQDISGSNIQFVGGGVQSPHYQTKGANGYPTALFDATNDILPFHNTFAADREHTILTVFNSTNPSGTGPVIQGVDRTWMIGTLNGHVANFADPGWVSQNNAPVNVDQFYVATAQNNLTTSSFWVDGTDRTQNSGFVGVPGRVNFGYGPIIGTFRSSFLGNLAEVIIYKRDISLSERQKIESYLALKYGITLGNGGPMNYLTSNNSVVWDGTANAAFHHNVAGFGRDGLSTLDQLTSRSSSLGNRVAMTGTTAALNDGEFLIWGHNNSSLTASSNVPGGAPSAQRLNRIWKMQQTGNVGNVTISFDLSSLGLPVDLVNVPGFGLLLDSDGNFNNATVISGATVQGSVVSFSGVNINSGPYFSLAFPYQPDLVLTKHALPAFVVPGDAVTYTLTFSNSGLGTAPTITITDPVPVNVISTTVISQSDVPLTQLQAGNAYTWQMASLAPGQGGTITITGQIGNVTPGQRFTNTATIATTFSEPALNNNTASAGITAYDTPVLAAFTPVSNSHQAALTSTVVLTYNVAMAGSSVNSQTVAVHGMFQGHLNPGYSTTGPVITLNPTAPFKPGELVQVSATTGTQRVEGLQPSAPTVWQFRAKATTGSGLFAPHPIAPSFASVANGSIDVKLGDIDGDGDLDAVSSRASNGFNVHRNIGRGLFDSGATIVTGTNHRGVALGDLDGDGDLDVILTSWSLNKLQLVYLNNGGAQGGTPGTFSAGGTFGELVNSFGLTLGDVDGDGDLDVATTNDNGIRLHLNQGALQGGTPATFGPGTLVNNTISSNAKFGDADLDGDLDLFVVYLNGSQIVHLNDGGLQGGTLGVFSATTTFGSSADIPSALALGDIDNDGDLDVAVGNQGPQTLHLNLGGLQGGTVGTFGPAAVSFGDTLDSRDVEFGDIDADGDLDLLVATENSTQAIYVNQGGLQGGTLGAFGAATTFGPNSIDNLALGDIDSDGDLDILAGERSGLFQYVFLNKNPGDVQISKHVDTAIGVGGQTLTYTLHFTSVGPNPAPYPIIADQIPAILSNIQVISSGVALTQTNIGQNYSWWATELPVGASGVITIKATLDQALTPQIMTNTATITAPVVDPTPQNDTASVAVTILAPRMTILGQGQVIADGDTSPTPVDDTDFGLSGLGQPVTHTFTISNSGQVNLTLNATPRVTITGPNVGNFSVTAQPPVSIGPNSAATFDVTFTPQAGGPLTATVLISGANDSQANPYRFDIAGEGAATELTLSKSVTPQTAVRGSTITYTLTFTNNGTILATGVVITDQMPISLTNFSVGSNKTITATGMSSYVWQIEDLAVGETGLITITAQISSNLTPGSFTNTASIDNTVLDYNPTNNSDSVALTTTCANTQLYVRQVATGTNTGLSWSNAMPGLQMALNQIATTRCYNTEVWVATGVYTPGSTISDTFNLLPQIQLYGGFVGTETLRTQHNWQTNPTILSGDIDGNDLNGDGNNIAENHTDIQGRNAYRVVNMGTFPADFIGAKSYKNNTVVDGFIITGGQADGTTTQGAGLACATAALDVGGECGPVLQNLIVSGNKTSNGGAGILFSGSSQRNLKPQLDQITFRGNHALNFFGSALTLFDTSPQVKTLAQLTNLNFENNSSGGSTVLIQTSAEDQVTLDNIAFFSNTSASTQGTIWFFSGDLKMNNVTFANNTGRAIRSNGNIHISNSIFWTSETGGNTIQNSSGTARITNTIVMNYPTSTSGSIIGSNVSASDPNFVNLAGGDLRLGDNSPAVDAGDNSFVSLSTDLNGDPRRYDDTIVVDTGSGTAPIVDLGAFERQTDSPHADMRVQKTVTPMLAKPGQLITYTLSFSNAGPSTTAGVVITDTLPVSLTVQSVISGGDVEITRTVSNQTAEVFETSAVSPGRGGVITITARITQPLPVGIIISNSVIITAAEIDLNLANNSSVISLTTVNAPPILTAPTPHSISETKALTFTAIATDANNDTIAPILDINALITPTGLIINKRSLFQWQAASDNLSGVDYYTLYLESSNDSVSLQATTTMTTSQASFTPTVDLTNGVYTWTVPMWRAISVIM